ncbi:hypothetical protein BJX61DRAFT_543402 [Aspergillus egyptiacus]|nr:hypothetical protein BJX61DRAFT_543402 [Aspergillus egyptiacus]
MSESRSTRVFIGDINKEDLMPAIFFAILGIPAPAFNRKEAVLEAEEADWRFDYLQGRLMKCNLSGDEASPWGYDRDIGQGAFAEVVEAVRNRKELK